MSLYGCHPTMSKAEARDLLPKKACRMCVTKFRDYHTPIGLEHSHHWRWTDFQCDRCGLKMAWIDSTAPSRIL